MSILLDTSFVVAAGYPDDRNSPRATELLREIVTGSFGAAFVTDYVVDEALTLVWARTRRSGLVRHMADFLLAPDPCDRPGRLVFVGEAAFHEAARQHRNRHDRLSFTDCTSLAVMAEHGISAIATFDRGFEGLSEVVR
jgi:predicted nucleic acid-binding protein